MDTFLLSIPLMAVNTSKLTTIINRADISYSVGNEFRDNECVIIENTETRKGVEDNLLCPKNIINKQDDKNQVKLINGNICLRFNGDNFKLIDVPGDGDCFYHSVLKCAYVSERIYSVQELRFYLRDMVNF